MARPRQVSDAEIIAIARQAFLDLGPGVSTTVIAERVGMSQAALFKRFGTKKGLMLAALAPPARPPFIDLMEVEPDERPVAEQLSAIGTAVASFFTSMVPCFNVLHASGIEKIDLRARYDVPPPVRTQQAMTGWLQRAIERGLLRPVDPSVLATAFLGTLHIRAFMQHLGAPGHDGDPRPYVEEVVGIFLNGAEAPR